MFPQIGSQTVIVFKHLQFVGQWQRTFPLNATSYLALKPTELIVVEENHAGSDITYWFRLKTNDEVTITYADAQVHIPALCRKCMPGDHIKCHP